MPSPDDAPWRLTLHVPHSFLRVVLSVRGTVLPGTIVPIILFTLAAAGVAYAVEVQGYDFSDFILYHEAHLMISIFLLAFAVTEGQSVWRRALGQVECVRASLHGLVLVLSSHSSDKEHLAEALEPFRKSLLGAVWVAFALVDPALTDEALSELKSTVLKGEVLGSRLQMLGIKADSQSTSVPLPSSMLTQALVDLLLENASEHALSGTPDQTWRSTSTFHFAFNGELLRLHRTLIAMIHDAESSRGVTLIYAHLLQINILCLILFTPLGFCNTGWLNPLLTSTVVLTYGGFMLVVRQLTDPFRCERRANGIPLGEVVHRVAAEWNSHRVLVTGKTVLRRSVLAPSERELPVVLQKGDTSSPNASSAND